MGSNISEVPRLSRRARDFVGIHGVRLDPRPLNDFRERWLAADIPAAEIDRVVEFEGVWGGLMLPPAPCYEGGPRVLHADVPTLEPDGRWWFEAGTQRTSVPFSFALSPDGEFGIYDVAWAPMHADVNGWIEAVALAHHAHSSAQNIRIVRGGEVDEIDLDGFEIVPETRGISDVWWRGADSLVAVYRGEAEAMAHVPSLRAQIYSGLPEWALQPG